MTHDPISNRSGARVLELFSYPIKGLTPQPGPSLAMTVADGVRGDRRYALALGSTVFDSSDPQPLDKGFFLMLRRDASLAALRTRIGVDDGHLEVVCPDGSRFAADLRTPDGRGAVQDFFHAYLGGTDEEDKPKLVEAEGHKFTDVSVISPVMMRAVSLINLASVRDLETRCDRPLHPLRFRANIYIDGIAPWEEFHWVGHVVTIGALRFRCVLRTRRCGAVDVDPQTGARDTALPKALVSNYGHPDCGVYLEVLEDGAIAVGDAVASQGTA